MSSRPLRHNLAGLLTVAFLALGAPVWAITWQWLAEQIGMASQEPDTKSDAGWMLDPDG